MVKKKKVKQKPKTIKRIEKTVVQHCFWISDFEEIRKIAKRYKDVKNYVYSRYSGINSLLTIRNHRKEIRNLWVKNKFAEQWKLPARYWKLALDESIANIKSNWSNTKNAVRKLVRYNEHLTDEEKQYIFYVLKADKILYSILRRELFVPTEKLKQLKVREKYIHNLIRRYIRKCKGSIPYSNRETSFMIDRPMYKYKDENTIEIASTVFGKRIQLQLQDSNIYSGNIRVVIKDNKIELHHCVRTKEKKIWQEENIVGIDKGYRHLLVTSSGHLYGDGLNDLLSKETERLNKINQKRNKIWAQMEQCKKDGDFKKAERIFKNNFGKKKYNKHKNQHSATVKSYINYSLNQFFYLDKPSEVVQEDLSFVSWKNAFPKHIKRKLSRWIKGYIKQRINYKCDLWNVTYTFVNPAYTSKICNKCHHFGKRTGDVFACEHCGKEHSDNNAAKNILHRKYDKEITLYTPYKKVKEILEKRIKAKLKTS